MLIQNIMMYGAIAKAKLKELLSDETGDINVIMIVVLIGIGIILALFFKEQMMGLLQDLFKALRGQAVNAVGGE